MYAIVTKVVSPARISVFPVRAEALEFEIVLQPAQEGHLG
jgi:hypothetical protein